MTIAFDWNVKHQTIQTNNLIKRDLSVIVDLLLIVTPIVGFCNCSIFCCALLNVHSSFTISLMVKREQVTLLCLSS